jgi:glycosyltransferase involved in cell wall biosynthesis
MKKLLIVSDNYAPRIDGIVRFLLELIPRMKPYFDIKVLAPDFGEFHGPVPQIKVPLFNFGVGDFKFVKPVPSIIKKAIKDADIVFVQTISFLGLYAINYAKKYKKPIITYKHSLEWELAPYAFNKPLFFSIITFVAKTVSKILFNKCDVIICPSHSIAEKLSWYNIKSKKVVVPVGIDSNLFIPPKDKVSAKISIGLNPADLIIGYHGRLANEKGVKLLSRVYRQLARKYKNIKLMLVGDGVDEVREFSEKKGAIVISGKKNVVPYLQAMDIYCMPSFTETSCLSLIEAMSCELACISTKAGMITDYVKNNKNGLLVNKKDNYSLTKALKSLIDDELLRKKLGKQARKTVKEVFDWDLTSRKIVYVLQNLDKE